MAWSAHGWEYAIGNEIHDCLSRGLDVVVNGSRAYLDRAADDFPDTLHPVIIDVDEGVLAERLHGRGRETASQVAARLSRSMTVNPVVSHPRLVRVDNNGDLSRAGERLLQLLRARP
jgi:ribose 1,5-bisphosphokinase